MRARLPVAVLLAFAAVAGHAQPFPTVSLSQLPGPLKSVWNQTKPEMTAPSRCAAAFDAGDRDRMTLQCSVYVRLGAEGERRAMRYCEEKRQELRIHAPCQIVVE